MTGMDRRGFLAATSAVALCAPSIARAQQVVEVSIGASHPVSVAFVNPAQSYFMPEVDRRLEGTDYRVQWSEFWGGTLFRPNATLNSVAQGIVDVGIVWSTLETGLMPLSQVSLSTPFVTDDALMIGDVIGEMNATDEAMQNEWGQYGLRFLGAVTIDTYHFFNSSPITRVGQLNGLKMTVPGAIGLWIRDAGAVPVNGNATTFYTDVQTGIADGGVVTVTGALASNIHEVAPYMAMSNLGAHNNGGLAMNVAAFERLPAPVQQVFVEVGRDYSSAHGAHVNRVATEGLELLRTQGAIPNEMEEGERAAMARSMADLGARYVEVTEAAGLPGERILRAYMDGLRARGATPLRDWDAL